MRIVDAFPEFAVFWHMASPGWLEWCTANRRTLSREFFRILVRYTGSRTGYYLGLQVVCKLEKKYSITEVAVLDDFESECRNALPGFL